MSVSSISTGAVQVYQALRNQGAQNPLQASKVKTTRQFNTDTVELTKASLAKAAQQREASTASRGAQYLSNAAQAPAPSEPQVYGRADVQSLIDQWGETKPQSEYDFNGDGRIDSSDLGELLARFGQAKPVQDAAEKPYTQDDVQRLLDAWNNGDDPSRTVSSRYDLDGDGRVNSTDLGQLLAKLSSA